MAPVKEPFSCPNSSLSSRCSGRAAQFTATKGAFSRPEWAWMKRANISLPVPDSPEMSTVALDGATCRARARTRATDGWEPMMDTSRGAPWGAGRPAAGGGAGASSGSAAWIFSQVRGQSQ